MLASGSPQGSILGPLLFTLYVNDLPQLVKHCEVKQYADDTTLYCASDNVSGLSKSLNADLEGVANWVEQNGLKLNETKTQMLLLGRRKRAQELDDVNVVLKGQKVERCGKVKYLVVWIDEDLSWRDHIEAVRRKCYAGLAKISRLRDSLPAVTKRRIYNALVLPHLDYCCVVWQECGKVLQQKVERIQNYAMRLICSKPPRTSSQELRKSMKWIPLTERREIFRLVHVYRCTRNRAQGYLSDFFMTNEACGHHFTRGFQKLNLRKVNTNFGRNSTYFMGSQKWNALPTRIREMDNIRSFKANLRVHYQHSHT